MRCALACLLLVLLGAGCSSGGGAGLPVFDAQRFGTAVDNLYFPLEPGTTYVFEADTEDGLERVEVEITDQTRVVMGVTCVVVHAREYLDGELVEDTFDWFAQDLDGNVWYFGEDSKEIENGVVVSTEGSWEAGVDGARPGIIMLAAPWIGVTYEQEYAPGVAEDMATVVGLSDTATTPLGSFTGCVRTEDFTPLEPGVMEEKFYAPGLGVVLEVDDEGNRTELVDILGG